MSPITTGNKNARVVFLMCGEGAHTSDTDISMLRRSPAWEAVSVALYETVNRDLEEFLKTECGTTSAPTSILVTTVINILNAAIWRSWGVEPDVAVGHSSGDVAAAHACGMYTTAQAMRVAHDLGRIAATREGGMLYTQVDNINLPLGNGLNIAGINSVGSDGSTSVTLCGPTKAIEDWLAKDKKAVRIASDHPWHHSAYADIPASFLPMSSGHGTATGCKLVTATAGGHVVASPLDNKHWSAWVSSRTDLPKAMDAASAALRTSSPAVPVVVIECGSHPVGRAAAAKSLSPAAHVASLRRGATAEAQAREARAALASAGAFQEAFEASVKAAFPEIVYSVGFAEQGIDSQRMVSLAAELNSFFPGVTVPHLYQHLSLAALATAWDTAPARQVAEPQISATGSDAVMVLGCGLELPPGIQTEDALWAALESEQIAIDDSRGAGFLTSFDFKKVGRGLGLSPVELEVVDPQHVLALSIVDSMWQDLDMNLRNTVMASRHRVGVYMGVWQVQEMPDAPSAYSVLGNAHSALASRIANTYGFEGPAVAINTACSSGLVAVDTMIKDLRAGRIDYAIVGGLNLIGDNKIAAHLRKANFLSPTFRCHTFSSAADGYVRSEGGVCFFVARDDGVSPCKGLLVGSAVNQNSQRKPITSVDPEAQAKLIVAACRDAAVAPSQVAAVEMHGTGTKIGDPVELRALSSVMGRAGEGSPCLLTAAKMHFGHLESGAGALGLLKVLAMLQRRQVPAYSVLPGINPMVKEAMQGSRLALVTGSPAPLAADALVGVSSFGFTGNNAHVIVKGPGMRSISGLPMAKKIAVAPTMPTPVPSYARPAPVPTVTKPVIAQPAMAVKSSAASLQSIIRVCRELGVDIPAGTPPDSSIIDLGLDSLGLAELSSRLSLPGGVDSIFDNPSLASIAALISDADVADEDRSNAVAPQAAVQPPVAVAATNYGNAAAPKNMAATSAFQDLIVACRNLGADVPPGVDPSASVIDLGLDSLGIAELASQLALPGGVDSIFDNPSLGSIAALVSGGDNAGVASFHQPSPADAGCACCDASDTMSASLKSWSSKPITPAAAMPESYPVACNDVDEAFNNIHDGEWIQTTHVGSLPRKKGASLEDMIDIQLEVGMQIVNDGEMTRADYISDVLSRISGVHSEGNTVVMPMASDMLDAPLHSRRFTGMNGLITLNKASPAKSKLVCSAFPTYQIAEVSNCKAGVQKLVDAAASRGLPASSCFWSVPSPGTIALFCDNQYFSDYTSYVNALAEAMRHEYEAIASTGVMIQVDGPDLAMGRHTRFEHMSDQEFLDSIFKANLLALNRTLVNIPASQTRVHVCWGNYAGPHTRDISAELLWPHLVDLKARYILCEMANPQHGGDFKALSLVASKLGDKVIVPGLVECTNPRVENPKLIAERLVRLANIVGPSHVMAGTDCGFASTANAMAITEDIVWMKLRALAEGAAIASKQLYNFNAPASTPQMSNHATARVVLCGDRTSRRSMEALRATLSCYRVVAHTVMVDVDEPGAAIEAVRWRIDWPVLAVSMCESAVPAVNQICSFVNSATSADVPVARRPAFGVNVDYKASPEAQATEICAVIRGKAVFNKRVLACSSKPLLKDAAPEKVDVVVVGSGLLGMYAATKIAQSGQSVVVLERRHVTGGIWSMYANSTSQVNTSEGAYCFKELLGGDVGDANRDHSSAAEIQNDLRKLAAGLGDKIKLGASVTNVAKQHSGGYVVHVSTASGENVRIAARGVVMAINDRVGIPRTFSCPGMEASGIQVAPGICDATSSLPTWRGKRVVIYGMGAFAVEATRTALEAGASEVVVVARRIGTVCPKIIDYQNFVNDWDENFQHDVKDNAKQMQRWNRLYKSSRAEPPNCWPAKIKPQGHTISVSDIWFVAHHMGKLTTREASVTCMEKGAVVLDSGERLQCDIFVPCIGFERNTSLCRDLTGYSEVCASNYLDKHLIYLADAEIDDNAFNSFFGSSVLEYAKFYTNVFIEGLKRESELGHLLWGSGVARVDINKRAWSQYIATAHKLFDHDPTIKQLARNQVDYRTAHFLASLPPPAYEAANRQEWDDIHTLLNGGKQVPKDKQLPYYMDF